MQTTPYSVLEKVTTHLVNQAALIAAGRLVLGEDNEEETRDLLINSLTPKLRASKLEALIAAGRIVLGEDNEEETRDLLVNPLAAKINTLNYEALIAAGRIVEGEEEHEDDPHEELETFGTQLVAQNYEDDPFEVLNNFATQLLAQAPYLQAALPDVTSAGISTVTQDPNASSVAIPEQMIETKDESFFALAAITQERPVLRTREENLPLATLKSRLGLLILEAQGLIAQLPEFYRIEFKNFLDSYERSEIINSDQLTECLRNINTQLPQDQRPLKTQIAEIQNLLELAENSKENLRARQLKEYQHILDEHIIALKNGLQGNFENWKQSTGHLTMQELPDHFRPFHEMGKVLQDLKNDVAAEQNSLKAGTRDQNAEALLAVKICNASIKLESIAKKNAEHRDLISQLISAVFSLFKKEAAPKTTRAYVACALADVVIQESRDLACQSAAPAA